MLYDWKSEMPSDKNVLIKEVSEGKHVLIDWKISLQYIMKKHYLETDRCDFILGI